MKPNISRRAMLRGAGVAITLPWLESLVRPAKAQTAPLPLRFLPIYLPCGAPELWKPTNTGSGAAWELSSVLALLAPLKTKVTVISGLENGSVFNANGGSSVEPAEGKLSGAWLTSTDPAAKRLELTTTAANGLSADQIMAAHQNFAGKTTLASLQVGLSTVQSYCDGQPCSNTRNVSWVTETTPMYKTVDPKQLFDQLVGAWPTTSPAPTPLRDQRLSVLDSVLDSAAVARKRLSATDKVRLDDFLESVRSVETKVTNNMGSAACPEPPAAPQFVDLTTLQFRDNTNGYNKGTHADLINQLVALAFQCDMTRIISYMLEDERSEFTCSHIPIRTFTTLGSYPGTGTCPEWHGGAMHGSQDVYASIVHWNVGKVRELCQLLSNIPEGDSNVLDNTVVYLAGALHGSNHRADQLPALLVGGGGGRLKTDQHVDLTKRPMRDLYFTLMNGVYDMSVTNFGMNKTGAPIALIDEILA